MTEREIELLQALDECAQNKAERDIELLQALDECAQNKADLRAEVARLKEENAHLAWRDKDKNKLITELADALENGVAISDGPMQARAKHQRDNDIVREAREAVK